MRAGESLGIANKDWEMAERASTWFVTRKYPPRVGGMERMSWELTSRMSQRRPIHVIALRSGSIWLPFFLASSALSILAGAITLRIEVLHLGDSLLAPLGSLAKMFDIPVCVTVHGRDVTYPNRLYRLWLWLFFRRLDAYICVSMAARTAALGAGAPVEKISVIGNGVAPFTGPTLARDIDRLLFVGRLV